MLGHFLRRPFLEAALLYGFFWFSAHVALVPKRDGDIYNLTPKGFGLLLDILVVVLGLTLFHLLYILPSLVIRKWLGVILKMLMYLIFVAFLGWMHRCKFVAVQKTPGRIVAIRHWPLEPIVVTGKSAELRVTGLVMSLTFLDGSPEGISSIPAYHADTRTANRMHELATALGAREVRHD